MEQETTQPSIEESKSVVQKTEYVTYDEFKKMDMRVGIIREVTPVPETDKLLKCMIDFNEVDEDGNPKLRQILSDKRQFGEIGGVELPVWGRFTVVITAKRVFASGGAA